MRAMKTIATIKRKSIAERAVRVNITLHPRLLDACESIVRQHGFHGISDYFQSRIRRDAGLELPLGR